MGFRCHFFHIDPTQPPFKRRSEKRQPWSELFGFHDWAYILTFKTWPTRRAVSPTDWKLGQDSFLESLTEKISAVNLDSGL